MTITVAGGSLEGDNYNELSFWSEISCFGDGMPNLGRVRIPR